MSYKNGKEILPANLLNELQKYIQGDILYVPKKEEKRAGWGRLNGTKEIIEKRNMEIYKLYIKGYNIYQLIEMFHLSEDSIRKIIVKLRTKDNMEAFH